MTNKIIFDSEAYSQGAQIVLGFPQYQYEDNFPHCDGEYDRWTKTIAGFPTLCYDYKNHRMTV